MYGKVWESMGVLCVPPVVGARCGKPGFVILRRGKQVFGFQLYVVYSDCGYYF